MHNSLMAYLFSGMSGIQAAVCACGIATVKYYSVVINKYRQFLV